MTDNNETKLRAIRKIEAERFNVRNELALARSRKAPAQEITRLVELYDDVCERQKAIMIDYADDYYSSRYTY